MKQTSADHHSQGGQRSHRPPRPPQTKLNNLALSSCAIPPNFLAPSSSAPINVRRSDPVGSIVFRSASIASTRRRIVSALVFGCTFPRSDSTAAITRFRFSRVILHVHTFL